MWRSSNVILYVNNTSASMIKTQSMYLRPKGAPVAHASGVPRRLRGSASQSLRSFCVSTQTTRRSLVVRTLNTRLVPPARGQESAFAADVLSCPPCPTGHQTLDSPRRTFEKNHGLCPRDHVYLECYASPTCPLCPHRPYTPRQPLVRAIKRIRIHVRCPPVPLT